jgi:Serine aminopeptidase, S33
VNPTTLTKDNFTVTKINYFFKNDLYVGLGLVKDFIDKLLILRSNLYKF